MNTRMNSGLSIDEISDDIAPDPAGKQGALDILRPLGVDRARFVLLKASELKEMSCKRDVQEKQSAMPRGNGRFLRSAVENYQFRYGPMGGLLGLEIIAALYLGIHRNRFFGWLEERRIDPATCQVWIDENQRLLNTMQAVNAFEAITKDDGVDIAVPEPNTERPREHPARHCGYGTKGSQLLAGVFLLRDQANYISWLQEKGITYKRPMAWAERQANEFRQLAGPKLPAPQYPDRGMK